MHSISKDHCRNPEVAAVLLVDATNAFNSLNRESNAKHLPHLSYGSIELLLLSVRCDKKSYMVSGRHHSRGSFGNAFLYALSIPCRSSGDYLIALNPCIKFGMLMMRRPHAGSLCKAIVNEGPSFGYFACQPG